MLREILHTTEKTYWRDPKLILVKEEEGQNHRLCSEHDQTKASTKETTNELCKRADSHLPPPLLFHDLLNWRPACDLHPVLGPDIVNCVCCL